MSQHSRAPAYGFAPREQTKKASGSSAMAESKSARDALSLSLSRLKRPSPTTSPANTSLNRSSRAPSQVRIADVLNIYAQDVAPKHARPYETAHRLNALAEYWGDRPLSAVNGKTCRDYVEHAGSQAAARRHLEDFRAAIIHHRREGLCSEIVEVVLPTRVCRASDG